ncbi:MAG TPA: response regulator [Gemmatimonadales bacterium]|nr:response regulator [Gemmatimonadales bacterium]
MTTDQPPTATQSPARALVVEDDPAQARLVQTLVQACGLTVSGTVARGEDALPQLSHADVALCDYQLAGALTGLDVLRDAKARMLSVSVIIMTAHGSEKVASEALRAGAADYVIKDASFTALLPEVLRRVLHVRRVEAALRDAQEQLVRAERRAAIAEVAVAISHEVNNPLMALRTQLELLRLDGGSLPDAARKSLDSAIQQVDRISTVLRRVAEHNRESTTYVGKTRMLDLGSR